MATERQPVEHYMAGGLEVIDILKAKLTGEQFQGFLRGNALKYLFRYDHKGTPVSDLLKATDYLRWLKESVEGRQSDSEVDLFLNDPKEFLSRQVAELKKEAEGGRS